jgi:hypothetical protein
MLELGYLDRTSSMKDGTLCRLVTKAVTQSWISSPVRTISGRRMLYHSKRVRGIHKYSETVLGIVYLRPDNPDILPNDYVQSCGTFLRLTEE